MFFEEKRCDLALPEAEKGSVKAGPALSAHRASARRNAALTLPALPAALDLA